MTPSLIMPLVRKDWYLHRGTLKVVLAAGLLSLALQLGGGVLAIFGLTSTVACTIIFGVVLCQSTVSERLKHHEPFVMSLPVTPLELAAAKVLANLSMFLMVWLLLMAGLFVLFTVRALPGFIPPATVAAFALVVGFLAMLCVSTVVRSEKAWVVTMMATNFAYGAVWLVLASMPGVKEQAFGPVAVWDPHLIWLLGGELFLAIIVLAFGAYAQSRRTSFL